jgi:aspartyl protease family protein
MRNVIIFSLLVLGLAAVVPRLYLERSGASPSATASAIQSQPANSRSLTLTRGSDGHFQTEATIDGRRIEFLVDTGASLVILRERDAARLGVRPARRDYTAKVSTANGTVMAAPVELNRVEVGGMVVYNVAALVLPDEALWRNLLGMSFLSKLRWEHRNGKLMLEQ